MSGWTDYGYDDDLYFKARIPILGAYLALNDRNAFSSVKLSKTEVMTTCGIPPFKGRDSNTIGSHMSSLLSITKRIAPLFIDHTRTAVTLDKVLTQWENELNLIYWTWPTLCEAAGDNPEKYLESKKFNQRGSILFFRALKKIINLLLYKWDYIHDQDGNAITGSNLEVKIRLTGTSSEKEARFVGSIGYYCYTDGMGNKPLLKLNNGLREFENVKNLYCNTALPNVSNINYTAGFSYTQGTLVHQWGNLSGYSFATYSYWDMNLSQQHKEYSCYISWMGEKFGVGDFQVQLYAITEYKHYGQDTVKECYPVTLTVTNGEGALSIPERYPPEEPSGEDSTTLISSSSNTYLSFSDLEGNSPDSEKISRGITLYCFIRIPTEFL